MYANLKCPIEFRHESAFEEDLVGSEADIHSVGWF
jgi:hypothetical protein